MNAYMIQNGKAIINLDNVVAIHGKVENDGCWLIAETSARSIRFEYSNEPDMMKDLVEIRKKMIGE